jgi:RNA polymerase sigma-70 factor (ECF subfamily)
MSDRPSAISHAPTPAEVAALRPYVAAYLRQRGVRDAADREDLAQATMLRALRADLSRVTAPKAWLCRIALNLVLDERRSEGRRQRQSAGGSWEQAGSETAVCLLPLPTELDLVPLRLDVRAALLHLTPRQRGLLVDHYWRGASYEDLAAARCCPLGTIKSRMTRARAAMKHFLADGR